MVQKAKYNAHTEPIFKRQAILKLRDLYIHQGIKLYHNISKKTCPDYIINSITINNRVHKHDTRQSNSIHKDPIRTELKKQSITYKLREITEYTKKELKLPVEKKCNYKKSHATHIFKPHQL